MRVNNSEHLVFCILIRLLCVTFIQSSKGRQNRTVSVSESVQFTCNKDPNRVSNWKHGKVVLFIDYLKIYFNLDNITLLENYSLYIQQVTLRHNGIYQCLQDERPVAEFMLEVEVPPKMFLTINDLDNATCINVEAGTDVTFFCHAVGARPSVNLSWTTDEENDDLHTFNFTVTEGREYQGEQMFNSMSARIVTLTREDGTITCRSITESGIGNRELSLNYKTYVLPKLDITINDVNIKSEVYIPAHKPLVATCHAFGSRPASHLLWVLNNSSLNEFRVANETIRETNNSFDTFSSVIFQPQNTSGVITCVSKFPSIRKLENEISLAFYTYLTPKLHISINGIDGMNDIPVAANQPVRMVCNASAARPRLHISWLVNNLPIEFLEGVNETSSYAEENGATHDIVSTIWYRPKDVNGSITCASQLDSAGEITKVHATYFTYVIPDMYLTINGNKWRNISTINITSNQMLTIICHADGARPVIQLKWELNARKVHSKSVQISNRDDQTFNITTVLKFQANGTEKDIMCFTRGLYDHNQFILAYIQVTVVSPEKETENYQEDTQSWKIFLIPLVLLLITVPSSIFVIRKYGSRSSLSLQEYQAHGNMDTNLTSSLSGNNLRKRVLEGLDLPEVPGGTDMSDYCPISEDDYDSYFELKDKLSHHRMFRGKDMCLILSMNSGHLKSRWMGTISLSVYHKKCVVFSTVSDVTVKKGDIHWDTYVKRVLDMPYHDSLVKLEGICVNKVNLYLVHEHLTCDSLESIISSRRIAHNSNGPLCTSEVTSYLMDILEGMEVLHSFGFLHPGLSTRKVLVTDTGHCKLYDFFFSEDAPNMTSYMKSKKDCVMNDLPPEALLRNEYTTASDVWCVAVVLWNLMTYDPIPVVLETLDERKLCKVHQEWPASHLKLKTNMMFECWDYDETLRPSINTLRSSFTKVLGDVKAFTSSEDFEESMTDLYIPMETIKSPRLQQTEMEGNHSSLERQQNIST